MIQKPFTLLLLVILTLPLLLTACVDPAGPGGAGGAATPAPGATPTPAAADATPETGAGQYGRAPDYSWLMGKFEVTRIQGGCAYLTYDPTESDAYGGRVAVGSGLPEQFGISSGDWIKVYGKINDGPAEMCPGQSYLVERLEGQHGQAP